MSEDWRNETATEQQKEKLRFFGCTWDEGITVGQASDALEECAKQFPDAEADYQKSQAATEIQMEKLRFFGCTWNGEITVGKASEALEECARQFPDTEAIWELKKGERVKIPGTFPVKEFDLLDKTPLQEVTIQKTQADVNEPGRKREALFCGTAEQRPLTYDEARAMTQEGWNNWIALHGSYGTEPRHKLTYGEARGFSEWAWDEWRTQHGRLTPQKNIERRKKEALASPPSPMWCSQCQKSKTVEHNGRQWCPDCGRFVIPLDSEMVAKLNLQISKPFTGAPKPQNVTPQEYEVTDNAASEKSEAGFSQSKNESNDWVAFRERLEKRQNPSGKIPSEEVTIQEAAKPQTPSPQSNVIPAREVQEYARQKAQKNVKGNKLAYAPVEECSQDRYSGPNRPAVRKPTAYKITIPLERFSQWTDSLLQKNQTCIGGHWLPVGPLSYVFASGAISIGMCRQMADTIELKGYCVEPDARFGSGSYEWNQTIGLFKPLNGDPIQSSAAYLGAANLLRLCVLITTADGKIDFEELEVFRRAIENQPGLTLTDHKRLLILEQLLVQELCSASKTAARIAKSIPADKRLVIGKLLVEVAAANNFITNGERRVLHKIFKSFEIPSETLENLITQISPSQLPRRDSIQDDVSKNDRWLWNHWRTGHPGVVIGDTTLAGKRWNFNDWQALNARWQDLHERLAARQKIYRPSPSAIGEKIQKAVAAPAPKDFTLDMARVYEITSETKEVVAILSILMEDEPEKSIAPPATITVPAPEIQKVSGEGLAAPKSTRFNGLDVAFCPILERLLTRGSWPKDDFKSLADEFHFMPSKIHDTLNEWADEVLGDFILDGEDPVIIRRELIAKETIYG